MRGCVCMCVCVFLFDVTDEQLNSLTNTSNLNLASFDHSRLTSINLRTLLPLLSTTNSYA